MNELDGGGWQSQMIGAEGSVPLMYQREQHAQGTRERHLDLFIYTSDAGLTW